MRQKSLMTFSILLGVTTVFGARGDGDDDFGRLGLATALYGGRRDDIYQRFRLIREFFPGGDLERFVEDDQDAVSIAVKKSDVNRAALGLLRKVVRDCDVKSWNTLIARSIAGKNQKALEGFSPDGVTEAVAAATLVNLGEQVGASMSRSIENTIGDSLDQSFAGSFKGIAGGIKSIYYAVRNIIKGRSGRPFTLKEIDIWKETVRGILENLSEVAKNGPIMDARSRDKTLRKTTTSDEHDSAKGEGIVDKAWLCKRLRYERKLHEVIAAIGKRRAFYEPRTDRDIVNHTKELQDLLSDIFDNIIGPITSYKDLAASLDSTKLFFAMNDIELDFDILKILIDPGRVRKAENKDSFLKRSVNKQRPRRFGEHDDW